MGLAALTFASVAGASVSATSTNANAAKHTTKKVAKKVTYKTTDSKLDQSVVYVSTGKNAVYSKPGTVKGAKVVASKATMASLANTKSVSSQFMAYQEATTSNGVKYLKVVSFDKKIRGYVYVGGVTKTNGVTDTTSSYNFANATGLVLKQPRLFNTPYGSQFGAKLVKLSSDAISSTYTASKAVVNANGDTYFYVTANAAKVGSGLTGTENSGWVNSKNLSTNPADQFSDSKITVNYIDLNSKATVDSQVVSIDSSNYTATLNGGNVVNGTVNPNAFTAASVKSAIQTNAAADTKLASYVLADDSYNTQAFNVPAAKASVVNVYVKKNTAKVSHAVALDFNILNTDGSAVTTGSNNATVSFNQSDVKLSDNKTAATSYAVDPFAAGLAGYTTDIFSFGNVVNNLFAAGKTFNNIYINGVEYTYNDAITKANNSALYNQFRGEKGLKMSDAVAQTFHAYYSPVTASTSTTPTQVVPASSNTSTTYNVFGGKTSDNSTSAANFN